MLNLIKGTVKHTLIYSLGNVGIKLMGLILLPLYTSKLSTADYGIWGLIEAISMFVIALFSISLSTAMLRWCSVEKEESKRKSIIFTTFIITIIIVLVLNAISQPFTRSFSVLFFDNPEYQSYLQILFVYAAFEILNMCVLDTIRFREKSLFYIIIMGFRILLTIGLNIYFLKYLNMGVKGVILAQLIGSAFFFILALRLIYKNVNPVFNLKVGKEMIIYSFPLMFSYTSVILLNVSDRYILKELRDYSEVGIYTLGYRLASVVNMFVITSFQMGFIPIAFKMFDQKEAPRFFKKSLTYYVFIMMIVVLAMSLFSKEIIILFSSNQEYYLAYTIVPLIAFAFVFKGIQTILALGFHYVKKTSKIAYIVIVAAVINIGLNFLLIPSLGIYGSALATIISSIIIVVMFYYFANKYYPIKYEVGKILLMFVVGIGLYFATFLLKDMNLVLAAIIKMVLMLFFPIILYFLKFYEPIEIERIKGAWKKWKNLKQLKSNISNIKIH
ncbi:MAG: oligosaccharide flippase family protein [Bacteroidota bacterium]